MYEKKRERPEPAIEDKPKFKGSKKFYLIAGGVALILIGGIIGGYFIFRSQIVEEQEPIELAEDCAKTLNSYKDGKLSVILCVKEDGSLAIFWQNLPKDTKTLNIYRKDGETGDSVLWKTVNVTGESGSLNLGKEEGGTATYTVEGVGANGTTNWSSVGNTTSAGTSGSPSSSGQTSTSSIQTPTTPPATIPPPTTPPPSQNSTSTTTPPPTIPPPATSSTLPTTPPADTSTIYYYTPSGQISGTSSVISTATFWVQHINKKIEIGWQNIPSSTTKIIIYRSQSESSGYTKLLEQTNLQTSYVIQLEDNAVTEDYYYKMEAKNDSTLIGSYGPVFLPGLQ